MEPQDTEIHVDTDAARAGSTPHIVRWILAISLFAAIALLSAIWIGGALTQGDVEKEASVSAKIAEREDESGVTPSGNTGDIEAPEAVDTAAPGETVEN